MKNTIRNTCVACYQKIAAQITTAKQRIFTEAKPALAASERLLQLALNEAEALAWETTYPHLVFPMLATEKIQAVTAWNSRQQWVRRHSPEFERVN